MKIILATFFFYRMFHGLVPFRINPFLKAFCQLELGNCTIPSEQQNRLEDFAGCIEFPQLLLVFQRQHFDAMRYDQYFSKHSSRAPFIDQATSAISRTFMKICRAVGGRIENPIYSAK